MIFPRFYRDLLLACLLMATAIAPAQTTTAAAPTGPEVASQGAVDTVDFNHDIRPLLSNHCLACHGPDEDQREAGLRLDRQEDSRADLGGYAAIVPGNPDESELFIRLTSDDDSIRMPPQSKGNRPDAKQIDIIRRWIEQGGRYATHWAYLPPQRPELPAVRNQQWPRNPIDHFVLARLEEVGVDPALPAERLSLARRVAIDLTGLPPSWAEAVAFANDRRPDAYERYVDSLLASPAFGERWGLVWLDLARYADSAGYADDPPRTIWAYRDYVISALNDNQPFDEFTIEQIAGDLLANPGAEQLIATAFHRNTMTNNEGGTNDEEFRNVAIVDRVNTTMAVWMGTTMACAQCHTHKYDPLTQSEYFQLFAFFNNTQDADRKDERPVYELWNEESATRAAVLDRKIAALEQDESQHDLDPAEKPVASPELARLQAEREQVQPITTVPVMRERKEDEQRTTQVQIRGNYQSTAQTVVAGTPAVFPPLATTPHADAKSQDLDPHAADTQTPPNRLALARWLVADDNPMTARVIANRHWEQLFGTGIVATSEDFGSQGEPPSHPELLDWLAVELQQSGWDLKGLIRLMVTSATYRQSSATTPADVELDPDNRLLSRGSRFRLSAELIRDQALFVSGLLSDQMYGPPVRPYQPALGLKAAFGSETDWQTSAGDDQYRRGIYTMWRRSSPYPSMATFDAPNREVCIVRRMRTNTPLQALVTLNDPVYVEAAQALGRRLIREQDSTSARIRAGFRHVLIREPSPAELERLEQLVDQTEQHFRAQPEQAAKFATEPLGELPEGADVAEFATWTLVGNVLLNLDEMFMKR